MADASYGTQMTEPIRPLDGSPSIIDADSRAATTEQDDDVPPLRGVVALPHPRVTLLIDDVVLDAEQLPRWQPQICVGEARLIDDDHE
jgi:hypothetical protein